MECSEVLEDPPNVGKEQSKLDIESAKLFPKPQVGVVYQCPCFVRGPCVLKSVSTATSATANTQVILFESRPHLVALGKGMPRSQPAISLTGNLIKMRSFYGDPTTEPSEKPIPPLKKKESEISFAPAVRRSFSEKDSPSGEFTAEPSLLPQMGKQVPGASVPRMRIAGSMVVSPHDARKSPDASRSQLQSQLQEKAQPTNGKVKFSGALLPHTQPHFMQKISESGESEGLGTSEESFKQTPNKTIVTVTAVDDAVATLVAGEMTSGSLQPAGKKQNLQELSVNSPSPSELRVDELIDTEMTAYEDSN